jgi:hypothetical protein
MFVLFIIVPYHIYFGVITSYHVNLKKNGLALGAHLYKCPLKWTLGARRIGK